MKTQKVAIGSNLYIEAIGFSMYTFLTGKIVKRDLYKGGAERSLGEYMEHLVRGKLAEMAFKKFLLQEFGTQSLLDIDLPIFIKGKYLPDILAFKSDNGDWVLPRFWIEVKAVVEGQKWALIRVSSLRGGRRAKPRPYDAYVNVRVHLPKDHVGRLIRYSPRIAERVSREWVERLTDLEEIDVEILGFALHSDMVCILNASVDEEAKKQLNSFFGAGWAFVRKGSKLHDPETGKETVELGADNCAVAVSKLRAGLEWESLLNLLDENKPLARERSPQAQSTLEREMKKAMYALSKQKPISWFHRTLDSGQLTLRNILRKR